MCFVKSNPICRSTFTTIYLQSIIAPSPRLRTPIPSPAASALDSVLPQPILSVTSDPSFNLIRTPPFLLQDSNLLPRARMPPTSPRNEDPLSSPLPIDPFNQPGGSPRPDHTQPIHHLRQAIRQQRRDNKHISPPPQLSVKYSTTSHPRLGPPFLGLRECRPQLVG